MFQLFPILIRKKTNLTESLHYVVESIGHAWYSHVYVYEAWNGCERTCPKTSACHSAPRRFAPVQKRCYAPDSMRRFATCST